MWILESRKLIHIWFLLCITLCLEWTVVLCVSSQDDSVSPFGRKYLSVYSGRCLPCQTHTTRKYRKQEINIDGKDPC